MGNWDWKAKAWMREDDWNPRSARSCRERLQRERVCLDGPCRATSITARIMAATVKKQSFRLHEDPDVPLSSHRPLPQPLATSNLLCISIFIVSRMLRKWDRAECSLGFFHSASFSGKWAWWLYFRFAECVSIVWMYRSLLSCAPVARPSGWFPVFASYKLSCCDTYVQVSLNISPHFPGMNAQESSCWVVQ